MILNLIKKHELFFKYCLIGVLGVILDFSVFAILVKGFGVFYQIANFISVSCGISNNFLLNFFINFKVKDKMFLRFIIFYFVGLMGIIVSALLLYLFVEKLILEVIIAKGIIMVIVTLMQYTLNKHFSFRKYNF